MAGSINKPKKPKSKRTPVRLRHRIEKAAAAKQRKTRKLAKQNPEWRSKLKKDPGIPNLFPYKEKLLHQIEETRLRKQEEAQRRRALAKAARTGVAEGGDGKAEEEDAELVDGEDGGDPNDETMDVEEGAGAGDDDDDDDEAIDESNPMAALLASARAAARDYKNRRRNDPDYEEGDSMDEDLDDGDEDEDEDEDGDEGGGATGSSSHVIEVPGGAMSRKAYDKVFKSVVEQADVVLYVLDARDPEGTRSRDVEQAVLAAAGGEAGKRLILVLNKVDLVPPPVLRDWLAHLRGSFPTLPLRAAGAAPNAHTFHHRDLSVASTSGALFRALKAFAASRNLKRAVSVGVIGYPNVGKSSVINALLGRLGGNSRSHHRAACPAGAEAGVTTAIRSVKIDSKLVLLDSPGIVFPSSSTTSSGSSGCSSSHGGAPRNAADVQANLVLLNAVPPKQIEDPVPAVTLLIRRLSSTGGRAAGSAEDRLKRLTDVYDLPALLPSRDTGDVTTDFLVQVARKRGRLGRGGVPNLHAAAMTVITDWRDGRIQGWADPPQHPVAAPAAAGSAADAGAGAAAPSAVGPVMADQKQIVTEWAKEFKLDGLWGDDGDAVMEE